MKKLLVVAAFLGLAAVVYAKVIRTSPVDEACDRIAKLCGTQVDVGECRSDMSDAEDIVGEKVVDKATDCMRSADNCMEAVGCMAGAATHALDDFEKGFERSRKR
jgi:hypothetical protein